MENVGCNIQIFVRLRPLKLHHNRDIFTIKNYKHIHIKDKIQKQYTFDKVFDIADSQDVVFNDTMLPIINSAIEGYNCTLFSYGQSGTGKTYTLEGGKPISPSESLEGSNCGFMARTLDKLFDIMESRDCEYSIRISFLAILNEELIDLLNSKEEESKLKIIDDSSTKSGVIVSGLEEVIALNKRKAFELLKIGFAKRLNLNSNYNASRPHSMLTITLFHKKTNFLGEEKIYVGKLNILDLSSNECNLGSLNSLRDVSKNNLSLFTLSKVIISLMNGSSHVPYRESKLTRVLQESLGGSTKTSILATISTDFIDLDETTNTLNLMHKAKRIVNKPQITKPISRQDLKILSEQIANLQRELDACRNNEGFYISTEGYSEFQEKIKSLTDDKLMLLKDIDELNTLMNRKNQYNSKLQNNLDEAAKDVSQLHKKCNILNNIVESTMSAAFSEFNFTNETMKEEIISLGVTSDIANKIIEVINKQRSKNVELLKSRIGYLESIIKNTLQDLEKSSQKITADTVQKYEKMIKNYEDQVEKIKTVYSNKISKCLTNLTSKYVECELKVQEQKEIKQKTKDKIMILANKTKAMLSNSDIKDYMKKDDCISELQNQLTTCSTNYKKTSELNSVINSSDVIVKKVYDNLSYGTDQEKLLKNSKDLSSRLSELINRLSSFKNTFAADISKINDRVVELNTIYAIDVDQTRNNLEELKSNLNVHRNNIDSNCYEIIEMATKQNQCTLINRNLDLEREFTTISDEIELIKDNTKKITDHMDEFKKNIDSLTHTINSINNNTSDIITEKENHNCKVLKLTKTLNECIQEVTPNLPTGKTPQKQDYNYQCKFKNASPQEQLRERFRKQKQLINNAESTSQTISDNLEEN